MRSTFITAIIIAALLVLIPGKANSPLAQVEEPNIPTPAQQPATKPYQARKWTATEAQPYKEMLRTIATAKGLSEAKIREIEGVIGGDGKNAICPNGESGWYTKAIGDNGTSFGLVQIHLPAHPNVTRAQAEDPEFALNFIVDAFLKGDEWMWTCWKVMYKPLPHSPTATTTTL
jgi:hypothetical protein